MAQGGEPTQDALPADDESIRNDDVLLRRVHPTKVVSDGAGGVRLSKSTFEDLTDKGGTRAMSVLVERRVQELGGEAVDILEPNYAGWGLAAVRAEEARACGLTIVWAPDEHEGRWADAHAHVFGKKKQSIQNHLRKTCEVRRWPATLPSS